MNRFIRELSNDVRDFEATDDETVRVVFHLLDEKARELFQAKLLSLEILDVVKNFLPGNRGGCSMGRPENNSPETRPNVQRLLGVTT